MLRDAVPAGQPITKQGDDNLMIRCPFHDDSTPSCSVSLTKPCYRCFGCGKSGTRRALLAKLTGDSEADSTKRGDWAGRACATDDKR